MRLLLLLLALATGLHANPNSVQYPYASPAVDAFGKLRVTTPATLFNSKQTHQQETVYWTTSVGGTGAAVTWDSAFSATTLAAGTSATGFAISQTRTYWPYSPGKSQLVYLTGNFWGTTANVIKRFGYFDDQNGLFIQLSGTAASVVIRSNTSGSVVDTNYPQSGWDDPLDGTGPSRYVIDWTKSQIFIIDFEWLGVGTVRYGVQADNHPVYFKAVYNNNRYAGVYMKCPNLPVRYEIRNNGNTGAVYATQICASVVSEGGEGQYATSSVATPLVGTAFSAAQELPLLAIRVKASHNRGANIRPIGYSYGATTAANGYGYLCYNCQVAGGTWISVTNTAYEYNVTGTQIVRTNTAAVLMDWSLITSGSRATGVIPLDPFLWGNFDYDQTTQDIFVMGIYNIAGNNIYLGTIDVQETR